MRIQRRSMKKARIEIIPMIDTIFFLLVFFMISTLSMARFSGVQVNLPKAASGRQTPAESAAVTLTKEGQLYLNKEPVAPEALRQALQPLLAKNAELLVIINADDGVPHGNVVRVMDEARQAGVTRLSIAVRPKENRP